VLFIANVLVLVVLQLKRSADVADGAALAGTVAAAAIYSGGGTVAAAFMYSESCGAHGAAT